jgi:Transposase and inactivated derivatives
MRGGWRTLPGSGAVRSRRPASSRLNVSAFALRSSLAKNLFSFELRWRETCAPSFGLNGGKLKASYSAASLQRNVNDELKRLRKREKVDLSEEIVPLLALSKATRAYIEVLDERLSKRAKEDPVCRRFLEIPGVGPITALAFFSAIDDPHRFRRNADIGAYFGLVPRLRQSGQSVARAHISKMGDRLTRTCLTSAAKHHLNSADSALAVWASKLSERAKKRGVYVALGRKLAVTMLAMWKSGEPYDAYYGISEG